MKIAISDEDQKISVKTSCKVLANISTIQLRSVNYSFSVLVCPVIFKKFSEELVFCAVSPPNTESGWKLLSD